MLFDRIYLYSQNTGYFIMKKTLFILAAGVMALASCNVEPSYKINGKAEGIADSTWVYLQEAHGMKLVKLDSAMILNEGFTLSGRQDSTVLRYLSAKPEGGKRQRIDFFLENGNINVSLCGETSATGTPSNDAYQAFKNEYDGEKKTLDEVYAKFRDPSLSNEQRAELQQQAGMLMSSLGDLVYKHTELNAGNKVGEHLFVEYNSCISTEQQQVLIDKFPEETMNNRYVQRIAKHLEILENTAVGKKFTDFELPTPDGKALKLSEVVSKNKYTLVDFWASWCAPCRAEMPAVKAAFDKYAEKGFGIVGISLDNDENAWKQSIKDMNMTWTHMSDLKGVDCEAALLYGIQSIPYTLLIDQDGTILARNIRGEAFEKKLEELFK